MSRLISMRMSVGVGLLGICACCGCAPGGFLITPVSANRELEETVVQRDSVWSSQKIVLVDVDGVLLNTEKPQLLGAGEHPVSLLTEKVRKAANDSAVAGLLLRINSPGGSVTASDLMYQELLWYKQTTCKPVAVIMMDVAASGGYYIACAADRVFAEPTSVTGSIGVIMQMVDFAGTLAKIGASADAIKSGPNKDAGSPFRKMTTDERAIFQNIVNDLYDRFLAVVLKGRPQLTDETLRPLADGRVYTARQAKEAGLIDEIGSMDQAIAYLKGAAKVDSVKVVIYHRPQGYKPNAYAEAPTAPPTASVINVELPSRLRGHAPMFMYLWAP